LSQVAKKLSMPVVVGLACVAGAVAFNREPAACNHGSAPQEMTPSSTSIQGEENMPVVTAKQIQHASEANFDSLVLKSDVPVLVDFYADWCGPCRRLTPILEELARETPDAKVVKVNVDHSPNLAAEYGVDSIPSLKVFKRGVVTDQLVGLANKSQLRSLITR